MPLKISRSFAKMCNGGVVFLIRIPFVRSDSDALVPCSLCYQPRVSQKTRAKLNFMHLCKYAQAIIVIPDTVKHKFPEKCPRISTENVKLSVEH